MKSGSRIVKKKILLLLLTKNRIKTDGNLNMFSQCLGQEETETKMYPAGFYLVKPFHLLNKDVLNKDNLSSNEASAWCECGDAAPRPTPGAGSDPGPGHSGAEPCRAGPGSARSPSGKRGCGRSKLAKSRDGAERSRGDAGSCSPRPGPSGIGFCQVASAELKFLAVRGNIWSGEGSAGGAGRGWFGMSVLCGWLSGVWGFLGSRGAETRARRKRQGIRLDGLNSRSAACLDVLCSLSALWRPMLELNGVTQLTYMGLEWEGKRGKNR